MEQCGRPARNAPLIASCMKLGKVFAALLIQVGSAEEESILTDAIVVDNGHFRTSHTPTPDDFISEGFKRLITTNDGHDTMEFTVDFGPGVSNSVLSVFLQNTDNKEKMQYHIHESHFRIGDDSTQNSTSN